tara:strand:+ start:2618 stop:3310 length:693 start_codon:yes stop_codon:yes gene_type:complete
MERKIRRFKRTCHKKKDYGTDISNGLNENFKIRDRFGETLKNEIRCEIVKRSSFSKQLKGLPKEIQRRIYIFAMKGFWKNDFLRRPLKPIWCDYKKYLDNQYKKCIIDNVHFMHLEFNTLPEYKRWIPGCQCDYCIHHHESKKDEFDKIFNDPDYFYEIIQCNSFECNFWNQHLIIFAHVNDLFTENMIPSIRIFDPLRGYMTQIYDQIKMSPHESPIYFSYEINNGDNH